MTRVALVTCERWPNLYEDDLLLVAALAAIGIDGVPAVWSRADFDWESFDALVMRSPWDYFERAEQVPADGTRSLRAADVPRAPPASVRPFRARHTRMLAKIERRLHRRGGAAFSLGTSRR